MQLRSPGGGFRNSSKVSHKKLSVPATIMAKKRSNGNMEESLLPFVQQTESGYNSILRVNDNRMDNTIEEKLHEETFGSRDFDKNGGLHATAANLQFEPSHDLMKDSILSSEPKIKVENSNPTHENKKLNLTESNLNTKL